MEEVGAGYGSYGAAIARPIDQSRNGTDRSLFGTDHLHHEPPAAKRRPLCCDPARGSMPMQSILDRQPSPRSTRISTHRLGRELSSRRARLELSAR